MHQFHPLIAKLEKALEEKIEIFKKESRKTLHSEMLELLYKLDELEAELKVVNFMIALGLPYLERTIGPIIKEVCEGTDLRSSLCFILQTFP